VSKSKKPYEENYQKLEQISESLNRDEIGIDDLVEKTREALDAARVCMDILNRQKGEFEVLEKEFNQLVGGEEGGEEN
jgi:exodeoxyribonuclease VII small subunit